MLVPPNKFEMKFKLIHVIFSLFHISFQCLLTWEGPFLRMVTKSNLFPTYLGRRLVSSWSLTLSVFRPLKTCLKKGTNGKVFLGELYFAGKRYLSTLSKLLFVKWNVNACFFWTDVYIVFKKKIKGKLVPFYRTTILHDINIVNSKSLCSV